MRQGPISTLRADPLNTTLILIEVNVADHLIELDSTSDVVDTVVAIFVIVERGGVQNHGRIFLV